MAPPVSGSRISDVREREWTKSIQVAGFGALVFVVGLLLLYFVRLAPPDAGQTGVRLVAVVVTLAGTGMLIYAGMKAVQARNLATIPFNCPYCETPNQFTATPTESFVCEACNRTVHFENGKLVPVRVIECQFCHASHRVAVNAPRFVCDKCNRPVDLPPIPGTEPTQRVGASPRMATGRDLTASLPTDVVAPNAPYVARSGILDTEGMAAPTGLPLDANAVAPDTLAPSAPIRTPTLGTSGMVPSGEEIGTGIYDRNTPAAAAALGQSPAPATPAGNQDVLLIAVDRRKENETAAKLQSLMTIPLKQAREVIAEASAARPIAVVVNVPPLKAEAIRRQLQELGATATTRPSQ